MGGCAYIIPGTLSIERRVGGVEESPSFLQRLLGRASGPRAPRVSTLPDGEQLFDVDPRALPKHLVRDFRAWIAKHIPEPSEGTQVPFGYVMGIEPAIYVRGLQRPRETAPQYNVQMTFSGCAGEAETSARVAAHWTGLWYRAEHERIGEAYLRPYGFIPAPYDPAVEDSFIFLPAGSLGYLELLSPDDSGEESAMFELDYSMATAHEGDPRLERLTELFGHYMRAGRCRCQLCDPDFGDAVAT